MASVSRYWALITNIPISHPMDLDCYFDNLIGTYRKPNPGMLLLAAREELEDAWMIGDREEDKLAADAAGFGFLDAGEWHQGASPWII